MMSFMKRIRKPLMLLLIASAILLTPQTSFGKDEIVVKPYNSEWVLVKKDAFDFFINETVTWKTKYERAMSARDEERNAWITERAIFKDALDAANERMKVYNQELLRLNTTVRNLARKSNTKDAVIILSLLGNLIQAIR
ncbi:MAG: hypothetical protein EOM59_11465 [Clostridia bacterium]|nr:hypothetical protein [Clostridia bacterium]